MAKRHVIVGAGPAGMHAIETIRRFEPEGSEIHLVCDEPPYARMVLPYYICGDVPESHVYTGGDDVFQKFGVTPHIGVRAERIDPDGKTVTLSDGTTLHFDTLLIATGSSPVRPPIEGLDLPGVTNLWTIEDARRLIEHTGQGKRVVFIGAGFVGMIVLNALYKRGCSLTVIEMMDQILPRMLDAEAARLATDWLAKRGVDVRCGTQAARILQHDGALAVELTAGDRIPADCVVIAAGVRPNVAFVRGSGVEVDEGIVVNERLQTNYPFIYAAGDCAQGPSVLGGKEVHAIQPTAIDHGRVAGANMAGQDVRYDGSLSMNVLDVCGLQIASFGRWDGEDDIVRLANPARPLYRKYVFDGDRMVGGILMGPTGDIMNLTDIGMVKGLVQTGIAMGEWKTYLKETHPLDLRRPYVALGVATRLLKRTLLPLPSDDPRVRPLPAEPDVETDKGPHHKVFVEAYRKVFGHS